MKIIFFYEEGCSCLWFFVICKFLGKNGKVCGVEVELVEWILSFDGGCFVMKFIGKVEVIEVDLVFLVMGFLKFEYF